MLRTTDYKIPKSLSDSGSKFPVKQLRISDIIPQQLIEIRFSNKSYKSVSEEINNKIRNMALEEFEVLLKFSTRRFGA